MRGTVIMDNKSIIQCGRFTNSRMEIQQIAARGHAIEKSQQ